MALRERRFVLGVDVGTSSSKGVLVTLDGELVGSAVREHTVDSPRPGWFEMSAETEVVPVLVELEVAVPRLTPAMR